MIGWAYSVFYLLLLLTIAAGIGEAARTIAQLLFAL